MALRVWLPLNGNLENQGLSGYSLKTMGTGIVFNTDGKIGKSVTFPNSPANCLYIDGGLKMQNLTWTCWFKSLGAGSGTSQRILSEGRDTGKRGVEIWLSKDGLTLNAFARGKGLSTSTTINTWHHVALVAGDTEVSLYLDGTLINTVSPSAANDYAQSSNAFVIGKMSYSYTTTTNYFPFNGYINDVRVYDECLSPKQVKEISKGLVAHYKLDNKYLEATTNLTSLSTFTSGCYNGATNKYGYGENTDIYKEIGVFQGKKCLKIYMGTSGLSARPYPYISNLFVSDGTNQPAYKTLSFDYYGTVGNYLNPYKLGSGSGTCTWTNDKTTTKTGSFTNSGNIPVVLNQWQHITMTLHGTTEANSEWGYVIIGDTHTSNVNNYWLFANVQLETKDHETGYTEGNRVAQTYESDCSGNGYNGIINGTLTFNFDSPRYSGSTKFNAGYLHKIPSPLHANSDAFTISCWFYPTQNATMCLINDRKDVGDGLAVFYINSGIRFDTGSNYQWQVGTVTVNAWNHIVVTWDKNVGNKKFYLNGNLVSTTTNYGTLARIGDVFSIGNSSTNGAAGAGNQIYGFLSDFRIYVTALSADDIKNLYMVRAGIDNNKNYLTYEFKEHNTDFFEINNLSGATNLKNNSYLISHATAYDGASIPISNFVIGKTYKMSYYFQKNDGSLQWLGGHAQGYSNMRYYIDGKYISAGYSSNTTSVDFIDDTDIHFAEVYFTCVGGTTNDALYIQPNRGKDVATTVKIYDLKFSEASFPENNNMNIDKRGLTCSTNLLQRSDRSNITENYSLVANSFIEI